MDKPPSITARVPSNIAFLKYWGKRSEPEQWPANDSLSMTLSGFNTTSCARLTDALDHSFVLNGKVIAKGDQVGQKAFSHLDFLSHTFGFKPCLAIESQNSFPTGCGIASSASGLGALTIAAIGAWTDSSSFSALESKGFSRESLAHLARRGSGSASRSLFGGYVEWQAGKSSHEQKIVPLFSWDHWQLTDIVILFSTAEKAVSSTAAHQRAWTSPIFPARLAGLNERKLKMIDAIGACSIVDLGNLIEQEALEMHSVIMSSTPAIHYLSMETGKFLGWWRETRAREQIEAYFTIDAGPNVHLICEKKNKEKILNLLANAWPRYRVLSDETGSGPELWRS